MANIRVDIERPIVTGLPVTFRSPADCSQVTGLIVYYPVSDTEDGSMVFQFTDAHGCDVGNIDHLFSADAIVKVILDVENSKAFIQNPDTNAYLEARFEELENKASNIAISEEDPEDSDFWIDPDDDSTVEDSHIANKENPHNVTLAQVKGCNENLLHNWYFADPIDQRGGYVVPPGTTYYVYGTSEVAGTTTTYVKVDHFDINGYPQIVVDSTSYGCAKSAAVRGYTGVGYSIDRWKTSSTSTVVIEDDGILLVNTKSNTGVIQFYENPLELAGKTVTFSVLHDAGLSVQTITLPLTVPTTNFDSRGVAVGDLYARVYWTTANVVGFDIMSSNSSGVTRKVYAAKLEFGTEQTLAHLEDGVWVLNEIPDKSMELLRCIQSTADASDTYANKVIATGYTCNKNLLDNWDFTKPVDQRGGWVVPPTSINPNVKSYTDIELTKGAYDIPDYRGVTIRGTNSKGVEYVGWETRGIVYYTDATYAVRGYTNAGYTIDRWKITTDEKSLTIKNGCIALHGSSSADCDLHQYIENFEQYFNKNVTLSALLQDGTLLTKTGTVKKNESTSFTTLVYAESTNGGIWVRIRDNAMIVQMRGKANTTECYVAVKLELGSEQTLAHLENGKWVLNEIPNKEEEEFKCIHSTADPNDTYANKPIGSIQMDLLWENASPTSAFAAQTISMDLTDYDMVGIIYFGNTQGDNASNNGEYGMQLFRKDGAISRRRLNSVTNDAQGVYIGRRAFTISKSGIYFYDTVFSSKTVASGTTDNNEIIPAAIYGIKGVS